MNHPFRFRLDGDLVANALNAGDRRRDLRRPQLFLTLFHIAVERDISGVDPHHDIDKFGATESPVNATPYEMIGQMQEKEHVGTTRIPRPHMGTKWYPVVLAAQMRIFVFISHARPP